MVRSPSSIDELRNFFLAEDRWQAKYPFRIGSLGNAPRPPQRLDVEESKGRQMPDNRIRRQLALLEQLRLIFADVPRTQAVWRTIKSSSKIFNCPDVVAYGSLCVIKTLEFFQHHFAKSGHRDLLMTRQLISTKKQSLLRSSHAKRPPQSGFVQVA